MDRSSAEYKQQLRSCLRWDPESKEAYLQLPSYPDLRLSPMRSGSADGLVALFNCPEVGKRLFRLPYPMPLEFAETMVKDTLESHAPVLEKLYAHLDTASTSASGVVELPGTPPGILGMPFKSLRTTSGQIIGDAHLGPHTYALSDRETLTPEQVMALERGQQVWDFGYVLHPDWHGKGVMSELVGCILHGWIIPYMGIGTVGAYVDQDNPASSRLLLKNGFKLMGVQDTQWPEEKGGGVKQTGRYELALS